MITAISLVKIHHLTLLQTFFLVRTFKIYSLSNFQTCNVVLLTTVTVLYISSPEFIYLITGSFYLLQRHYGFHGFRDAENSLVVARGGLVCAK